MNDGKSLTLNDKYGKVVSSGTASNAAANRLPLHRPISTHRKHPESKLTSHPYGSSTPTQFPTSGPPTRHLASNQTRRGPPTAAARALDSCPEQSDFPAALTTPTSTSNDISANSLQQSCVSNHPDTLTASQNSFPALSAPAAAAAVDLATAIDTAGPPTVFLACPMHSFYRAEDFGHEPDALAPCICPTMTTEEIDEDLLENIIEDAQRLA
ncbi:hypothetical protein EWM64_g3283 [Hericium alpestre]|uniref:Uncharacterized protein n=1 Tax=Hericium alpestre TaxID=135208 RepID=A0A4Z0A347_9AGAM|nr:hypothetical protein EWM64_g3283 [Hericium alpestre]